MDQKSEKAITPQKYEKPPKEKCKVEGDLDDFIFSEQNNKKRSEK